MALTDNRLKGQHIITILFVCDEHAFSLSCAICGPHGTAEDMKAVRARALDHWAEYHPETAAAASSLGGVDYLLQG